MKKSSLDIDWPVTARRFVAFIDIMGFKDMVARQNHESIYSMMKRVNELKNRNSSTKWSDKEGLVRTTTYSDSIMIYSKNGSKPAYTSFSCTVSALVNDLFLEEIPHKGAVAYGLMTLDEENSIFFGQPLIDAYLLQEELYFYGVVLHSSAENKLNLNGSFGNFSFKYLCPFKNGASLHNTIYPICAFVPDGDNEQFEKLMTAIGRLRYKTSGQLRRYIDNTEAFVKSANESR